MSLLPAALLLGLAAGYWRGGSWSALTSVRLRRFAIVGLALLMQLSLAVVSGQAVRDAVIVTSYGLVGLWLALNALGRPPALRRAIVLVALGWALNVAVIVPNHGMPVSRAALAAVGRPHAVVTHGNLWKHVEASSRTTLRPLGDVIPINVPLLRSVISAGDVLMLLGIALGVAVAMGRPVVPSGTLPRS